jgi:hypothetical protein
MLSWYQMFAVTAYIVLMAGLFFRKRRSVHVSLMGVGISMDVILVLVLEVQRSVIQSALHQDFTPLQKVHIVSSVLAVLLYVPVVTLGILMLRRGVRGALKVWHIRIGSLAFLFRTLGVVFMFAF